MVKGTEKSGRDKIGAEHRRLLRSLNALSAAGVQQNSGWPPLVRSWSGAAMSAKFLINRL